MFNSICRRHLHEATRLELSGTDTNQVWVQQCSNILMRHIEAWQQVQDLFMPGIHTLRDESTQVTNQPHSLEDLLLFLPSQINGKTVCPHKLEMIKFWLREGQAFDALNDICQLDSAHVRTCSSSRMVFTWPRSKYLGSKLCQNP